MRRSVFPSTVQAFWFTALVALNGCTSLFYDDRCGVEGRDVTTVGTALTGPSDTLALADLQLGETREDGSRSAYWLIQGDPLQGHLNAARLVASEDTGAVFFPLTGGPAEPDYLIEGQLAPYVGPPDFDQLFDRARNGGLTVVLETDLADHRLIILPLLQVIQFNDWGRPHCS